MTETRYQVIEAIQPEFPPKSLLLVQALGRQFTVTKNAFGPNTYHSNLKEIGGDFSHPKTKEKISFRPATTSESILAAAYDFANQAKPHIFDPYWLQAGRIVRTQDGVFTNTKETDQSVLKKMLNKVQKVNGIYILNNDVSFAPYETFERGVQESEKFIEGGLARALEHTREKVASEFKEILKPELYKLGVDVWGFDSVDKPALRVACLVSFRGAHGDRLDVDDDLWDNDDDGFAFGVLSETDEAVRKILSKIY